MRDRRAFTLVELLVVIAVVVLLIAILIPSLSRARASSRRSACMANEHGLSQTQTMYIAEWDALVPASFFNPVVGRAEPWPVKLAKYGNSEKLRRCPEAIEPANGMGSPGTATRVWCQPADMVPVLGAYALNAWLRGNYVGVDEDNVLTDVDDLGAHVYVPENAFHMPMVGKVSNIPSFADAILPDVYPVVTDVLPADLNVGSTDGPGMGTVAIARHGRSVNVAFFDDHAENVPLPKLWNLDWHRMWVVPRLPIMP